MLVCIFQHHGSHIRHVWGLGMKIHQLPTTLNLHQRFSMVFTMGSLASFLSINFRKFDVWSPHVQWDF